MGSHYCIVLWGEKGLLPLAGQNTAPLPPIASSSINHLSSDPLKLSPAILQSPPSHPFILSSSHPLKLSPVHFLKLKPCHTSNSQTLTLSFIHGLTLSSVHLSILPSSHPLFCCLCDPAPIERPRSDDRHRSDGLPHTHTRAEQKAALMAQFL